MTEVAKTSTGHEEQDSLDQQPVDLKKALRQQLETLRFSGLSHLPAGTGQYQALSCSVEATTGSGVQSATPDSQPVVDSNADKPQVAKESLTAYSTESSQPTSPPAPPVPSSPAPQSNFISADPWEKSLPLDQRKAELNVLRDEIAACTKCEELSSKRTQTVFGVGNPAARLVFVGEGPGAQEDRLGEPFVGEAGKLLDKIMGACNLTRSDVFILNAVKCRPPANRNPSQDELSNCWGYAERQLEILQPEFICCLGSVAARTLLKTSQSLGRLRKQFHSYRGSRVLVTYHPAYLLRTPSAKRHVWDDLKMLMKEMGVELSK